MDAELKKELLTYIELWCVEADQEWGSGLINSIEDAREQSPDNEHVKLYDKVKTA